MVSKLLKGRHILNPKIQPLHHGCCFYFPMFVVFFYYNIICTPFTTQPKSLKVANRLVESTFTKQSFENFHSFCLQTRKTQKDSTVIINENIYVQNLPYLKRQILNIDCGYRDQH